MAQGVAYLLDTAYDTPDCAGDAGLALAEAGGSPANEFANSCAIPGFPCQCGKAQVEVCGTKCLKIGAACSFDWECADYFDGTKVVCTYIFGSNQCWWA